MSLSTSLFGFSPKSSRDKLDKQIARLKKKRRFDEATALQQQLCNEAPDDLAAWTALAELATAASLVEVALTARFRAAKLARSQPEVWLDLANWAAQVGQQERALDAKFRAADGYAVTGRLVDALALFDQVLAINPNHKEARRIEQLIRARLSAKLGNASTPSPEPDATARASSTGAASEPSIDKVVVDPSKIGLDGASQTPIKPQRTAAIVAHDWEEATITFVGQIPFQTSANDPSASMELENLSIELEKHDPHSPYEETTGERRRTEVPAAAGNQTPALTRFVCEPQRWPTVLDHHALIFVGSQADLDAQQLEQVATHEITLGPDVLVYRQGTASELLYLLDRGQVRVVRERGMFQDLGSVAQGSFFGEVGTIAKLPSTTTVVTIGPAKLRVLNRDLLRAHLGGTNGQVQSVIHALRSWYLETVMRISPVLSELWGNDLTTAVQQSPLHFAAGQPIVRQGHPAKLYIMLSGIARVTHASTEGPAVIGHLCAGDLIGELDPSPVTVHALSAVSAIALDRKLFQQWPEPIRIQLRERIAACRRAVT